MADIGAKISIDGEKQFRQELNEITQAGKTLSAQMDTLTSSFDKEEASEEDLAKVSKKLSEQIENQKKLVDKLKEAVRKSTEKTGENSVETQKWKEKLAKAEKGLNDLEKESKEAAGGVKDLSGAESDASEKTSVFGDVLKGNLASEAIRKGISMTVEAIKDVAKFFVDAVQGAAEYADEVNTLAKTTGMSTDAIQEYQYAAELLDVEFSTIEGSLTKLTKKMSDAKNGSSAAKEAFEKLGVNITNADGSLRDANDVFNDAIDALGKIPNETERDAAAMDLFGKSAKELNPLIEAGAEAMSELRKEAHNVGAVMDSDTLNAMSEVQDGIDRLKGTWEALKRTLGAKIGVKILPELEKLVSTFQKLAETGDLSAFVKDVSKQLGNLVKKIPGFVGKIAKELPKALKELANSDLWSDLGKAIGETLAQIFLNLPELLEAGLNLVGGIIKGALESIPSLFNRLINGFDEEMVELDEITNEHVEAVRKKISELPDVISDVEDSLSDVNAKQREAERWVDIIEDLQKKTNPTAEDTERLKIAVNRLVEIYPELGSVITDDTDLWKLNTSEIRTNIEALADRAKAEAYIDAASDAIRELIGLEKERADLDKELSENTMQQKYLTQTARGWERVKKQVESLIDKYDAGTISMKEYQDEFKKLTGMTVRTVRTVNGPELGNQKGLDQINEKIEAVNGQIDKLKKEQKPLKDGIKEVDDAMQGLNEDIDWLYEKADEYTNAIVNPVQNAANGVYTEGKKVGKRLDDGIKDGIDANSGIVANAAGHLIQAAINKMKATAQIQSPSKVTRKLIGKNLALGVVKGWDDVFKGGMRNPISLSGAIGSLYREAEIMSTRNETTNLGGVTINVAGAQNMDENKLADIIMLKIQAQVDRRRNVFSNVLHIQ